MTSERSKRHDFLALVFISKSIYYKWHKKNNKNFFSDVLRDNTRWHFSHTTQLVKYPRVLSGKTSNKVYITNKLRNISVLALKSLTLLENGINLAFKSQVFELFLLHNFQSKIRALTLLIFFF